MRVISGSVKGRILKAVPGQNTRPTTDKVKESLFNIIGPYFNGGVVLDLFAGTGGLAIEALSRGMEHAILIDHNKLSCETIRKNLEITNLADFAEVYQNDAFRSLKILKKRDSKFDLIFLDPPYRMKVLEEILNQLIEFDMVQENGTVVAEHDARYMISSDIDKNILEPIKNVTYGDIGMTIFRKK